METVILVYLVGLAVSMLYIFYHAENIAIRIGATEQKSLTRTIWMSIKWPYYMTLLTAYIGLIWLMTKHTNLVMTTVMRYMAAKAAALQREKDEA